MKPPSDAVLLRLSRRVGRSLGSTGRTLTAAESCTGGWIGKVLTDVPGSSQWLRSAFVTYANEAKSDLLGVPAMLLKREGAVSEAVVRRMARGALSRARADVAVAVSGIAGPGGGSSEKPVGMVWFGRAERHGRAVKVEAFVQYFDGNRDAVRRCAVACALKFVLRP